MNGGLAGLQATGADRAARLRHGIKASGAITEVASEIVVAQSLPVGIEDDSPAYRYPVAATWDAAIGANAFVMVSVNNPANSSTILSGYFVGQALGAGGALYLMSSQAAYVAAVNRAIYPRDTRVLAIEPRLHTYAGALLAGNYLQAQSVAVSGWIQTPQFVVSPGWWVCLGSDGAGVTLRVTFVGYCRQATADELRVL